MIPEHIQELYRQEAEATKSHLEARKIYVDTLHKLWKKNNEDQRLYSQQEKDLLSKLKSDYCVKVKATRDIFYTLYDEVMKHNPLMQ